MSYRCFLYVILALVILSCNSRNNPDQPQQPAASPASSATDTLPQTLPPKPDSAYLIVPGERIGQLTLGETAELVNSKLGKPDSGDAAMGKALNFWINDDEKKVRQYVAVYFVRDMQTEVEAMRVDQVQVTSPVFQTPDSVGTGSSLAHIRRKYNLRPIAHYTSDKQQQVYIYDDAPRGIAFEVTLPDSTCTAVTIHRKNENIVKTYLPLHPDMIRLEE